jgi:hypothetical protein
VIQFGRAVRSGSSTPKGLPYPALYGFPAINANVFSLLFRIPEILGYTSWKPIREIQGYPFSSAKSFHVDLRVNDSNPNDGARAFRVRADYGC